MAVRRALILAAVLAAGCGGDDAATPDRGSAVIDTGERRITLRVEVARSDEARRRGLMGRTSLARDAGMAFVFPGEHRRGGFWMKDTLIPLSVAFLDGRGRVLEILDMAPCPRDPCPVYRPAHGHRRSVQVL